MDPATKILIIERISAMADLNRELAALLDPEKHPDTPVGVLDDAIQAVDRIGTGLSTVFNTLKEA